MNVQIQILKNCFNKYDEPKSFTYYQNNAKKYYKYYYTLINQKNNNINIDNLRKDIKKWLFNLSLEDRLKICTVENEFICKCFYQMYLTIEKDSTMEFRAKHNFYTNTEIMFQIQKNKNFNEENNTKEKNENNNNNINLDSNNKGVKLIKISKNKKKESTVIFPNDNNNFTDDDKELIDFNFSKYFQFKSSKISGKKFNISIFNDIKFFSVHHSHFPDCMTLSPNILIKEEFFDNFFNNLTNNKCFKYPINPNVETNENNKEKIYNYCLPYWINNDNYYSPIKYILAFFEQTIMIKYFLNENNSKKDNLIFSLIKNDNLNKFFNNRKKVINYLNNNYDIETRNNIFDENTISIRDEYDKVKKDVKKMSLIKFWKNVVRTESYEYFTNSIKK